MDLTLTDEQFALREGIRACLRDTHPAARVAELADGDAGWDPEVWPTLAAMGLLGLSVPEALGGAGAGLVEEVILFEEAGAALLPGPLFSTVAVALPALLASSLANEFVPQVVSGERRIAVAWADEGRTPALAKAATTTLPAELDETTGIATLTGSKHWVADLQCATTILVAARAESGAGLFLLERDDPGVRWEPVDSLDRTRRMYTLTLDGARARSLVDPSRSWPVFGAMWRRGLLLAAAEAVGISARLIEISSGYASAREQFGRPIGTYQGISHQVADMYMHAELGRSLCLWGALEADAGTSSVDVAVAAAASVAFPNAVDAAERAIQIHGGIGMTWESILHRYFKRSLQLSSLDSAPELQRHQISRILLDS
jgi:alkylation response protein AidB-like acyl-CoA dehydrogenase